MDHVLTTPAHIWTNIVLALDQYLITFHCKDGVCPNPMDAMGIARGEIAECGSPLCRAG